LADETSNDELVFQARVEDFTKKFFEEFDNNVQKVAQKTEQGFSTVNSTVESLGPTMAIVGGVVAGLTEKLVSYAAQLADQFIQFMQESEKVAERVEALGESLRIVGENTGTSMLALHNYEEGMKEVGLTAGESRQALLKMMQAELDLKDSSKIAQVALDASATGGISTLSAEERIIQSITYQSPRMLRSVGLVVDFQQAFKAAQLELGRSLTDTEKKQISMNLVLEAGEKIQGAYAASLNTAAGMEREKATNVEKLQEAMGKLATPALYETLKATNEVLVELLKYISEHKDDMSAMADDFASMTKSTMSIVGSFLKLVETLEKLAGPLGSAGNAVKILRTELGQSAEPIDIFRDAMDAVSHSLALASGGFAATAQFAENLITILEALGKYKLGLISAEDFNRIKAALPSIKKAGDEAFLAVSGPLIDQKTNLDNVTEATDNAAEAAKNLAEVQANDLAVAVKEANAQLQKLKETQERAAAERAIKAQRDEIEEELKLQWDREDQERASAERVQQILKNADDQRAELAQQAADNRYQIEVDYRKRLAELLENYNYEASELARKRDAVGMLALARQYKRDLEKEKKAQEERRQAAQEAYQKSVAELEKSVQKQLDAAEEARNKELESYQRNLDRQKELKALHDQWEEEDRQRKLDQTLEDMVKGFGSIEGMTAEGLQTLVNQWSEYFATLPQIVAANMDAALKTYQAYSAAMGYDSGGIGDRGVAAASLGTASVRSGLKGQSGIVSQLLTPEGIGNAASIGQTPIVRPSSTNYEKRELLVRVDGNALNPHIQRQLVKTLEEIERNRG
jgi:hypothetical protein